MIPPFDAMTGNLPPGIYEATWGEILTRYSYNAHRRRLLNGLKLALAALRFAGCRRAYLNGSFISTRADPADYDVCWERHDVSPGLLDPVFRARDHARILQKMKYQGEFFTAEAIVDLDGLTALEFFQRDKVTLAPKGIVAIDLEALR